MVDGIDVQPLNPHYAGMSTDKYYSKPKQKFVNGPAASDDVASVQVSRHTTFNSYSLDQLPAWFLGKHLSSVSRRAFLAHR